MVLHSVFYFTCTLYMCYMMFGLARDNFTNRV